jgi:hypothetical protein
MIALCLICLRPNSIWLEFLSSFIHYDIYVIIDDNTVDISALSIRYPTIQCIQVANDLCATSGFINTNFVIKKDISGWDKALYYFAMIRSSYEKLWFIEDDVFFHNEGTLKRIDTFYPHADLLSAPYVSREQSPNWIWNCIHLDCPTPHYKSMCCAVRVSNRLMATIREYAAKHGSLFFLEALFPTLCKHHSFRYHTPIELCTIYWRHTFHHTDINKRQIYHPVKRITAHSRFRQV